MKRLRTGMVLALLAWLPGCNMTEVERELGYKGPARTNAWLAAERFTERYGYEVRSITTWRAPEWEDAVWLVPADVINNESFVAGAEEWISDGGHMILVMEYAEAFASDWGIGMMPRTEPAPALLAMLARAGLEFRQDAGASESGEVVFDGETYETGAAARSSVAEVGGDPGVLASAAFGDGRLTVLTDGRIFRNRWIGDADHAALLLALIEGAEFEGSVVYVRGAVMSFWRLLVERLWPFLIGLGALLVLWLWRSFSRFGPLEPVATASALRGYDHHLEALGNYQWRLDRAKALLVPLREQLADYGHRLAGRDEDAYDWFAQRADLPRERVFRALAGPTPSDPAELAHATADLQRLLHSLH